MSVSVRVRIPQAVYINNELLRRNATGSFRDLVMGISRDPAMLIYLDNNQNRREHPNENYARELMELFTLGIGHYTEDDVMQAARAFTGWSLGIEGAGAHAPVEGGGCFGSPPTRPGRCLRSVRPGTTTARSSSWDAAATLMDCI